MASSGGLSSSLNHLINTYNSQIANNEINKAPPSATPTIQQPIIACTAPALESNGSMNEMSAKLANITLSSTDRNNNTTITSPPLVTIGGSPLSGSRRKSSTSSYTNLAGSTQSVNRPTNLRSTESSPEQTDQSITSNNLLCVNTSGMKSRRHSDNAINVPKIEIAPRWVVFCFWVFSFLVGFESRLLISKKRI